MPAFKDEKRNTWYCQFYFKDFTGQRKQKRKRGFKRKQDAQEYEREFLLKQSRSCDMTLGSMADLYMTDMANRLRTTTVAHKQNIIDTKIRPYFGNRKIAEISSVDIRDWQNLLKTKKDARGRLYSETYLRSIHSQIAAIFHYAVRFYGLRNNPCEVAGSMGTSSAAEMQIITAEQYSTLREQVKNESIRLALDILFWSGCREGECLALTPIDVTENDQLVINKSYHRIKGEDIIGPTKNKNGTRTIPIPHWLCEEFRAYCTLLYGLQNTDRVFYFTKSALLKEFKRATAAAGTPAIRIHDLRHSHASLCVELGYSTVLIAKRLGDTVQLVEKTYAHLYPNKQEDMVQKMEQMFQLSDPEKEKN